MTERPAYPVDDLLDWMVPGILFLAATMGGLSGTALVVDASAGFLDRPRPLTVSSRAVIGGA